MAVTTVAQEIVEAVRRFGVRHVFCVPGESYLATLQAFGEAPDIQLIATRHEEGAGLMAEAYAKATGRAGVVLVTRGPGLTHLSIALHTALQDSTPLLAVVGQVPRAVKYREAFQEMDIPAFAAPVSKWAAELDAPDRVGEITSIALHTAESGRPGPVVLSLPEDVDRAESEVVQRSAVSTLAVTPDAEAIAEAAVMLRAAERPCIIAGEAVTRDGANEALIDFAEVVGATVYSAWRRFDVFPNSHPLYLGPLPSLAPDLYEPLRRADLVISVGTRLDEFSTLFYGVPNARQRLLFIGEAPEAITSFDAAESALIMPASPARALPALTGFLAAEGAGDRATRLDLAAKDRIAFELATTPRERPDVARPLDLEYLFRVLARCMPSEARITSDAGTFAGWLYRFQRWERPRTFYGPTAGGMGYAVPAAIGVKLEQPDVPVLAFAGDGGFAMTMSELETAVRYGLGGLVFLVFDNAKYGTIAKHQAAAGMPGSVGTELGRIDFAATAESMGARGITVRRTEEFEPALTAALAEERATVIHLVIDDDDLDPWSSYSLIADPVKGES